MAIDDEFIDVRCAPSFLDKYVIRCGIVRAVKEVLPLLHGTVLDIGCGRMPYRQLVVSAPCVQVRYIGLDLPRASYGARPDVFWDGQHIPLPNAAIHCALATEVFEHCPEPERLMREICRVLKPGGLMFFTTPFVWPLHEAPHDEYRYTPFSIERHLSDAGFGQIELKAMGGWDATLAQMLGLWVRRRPMSRRRRRWLSRVALPVVRFLADHDEPPADIKSDQLIYPGLYGMAVKPRA